jgi:hypothetical protein
VPVDAAAAAATVDVVVTVEVAFEDSVLAEATGAELSTEDTEVVKEEVCELAVEDIVEIVLVLELVVVLVLVLVLLLEVEDEVELAALVKCKRLTLSSKQIPEEQGSLAQQPRKSPAEQTYHCCDFPQIVSSRRPSGSILKEEDPSS